MSSPRYDWWSYAKSMVRHYPALLREYRDLRSTRVTARLDGLPGGNKLSRPVEDAVQRTLPPARMRELRAVHRALQQTKARPRGEMRVEMIRMVYWNSSHTLAGAALRLDISEVTAKRWNGEFLRAVGKEFGLLDA